MGIADRKLQYRFSVDVPCGVIRDQLTGPLMLHQRQTADNYLIILMNGLALLMAHVPLKTRRGIFNYHDSGPTHSGEVTASLTHRSFGRNGPIP
jgi:hypothetical protein